ncbi:hypothetical protein Tco_0961930 [Tanacetum coccineum]
MTHDPPERVVRFINGTDEVAYKMPHKIEQYDLLSDLEKEHTKSVYHRNEEDKRRGVEYGMSKILGFYKESLELEPGYLTGMDDEGEVTASTGSCHDICKYGKRHEHVSEETPRVKSAILPSMEVVNPPVCNESKPFSYNEKEVAASQNDEMDTPSEVTLRVKSAIPNYLRASTGYCHDICKYGKRHEHVSEETPRVKSAILPSMELVNHLLDRII